jgi:hypothetical protein
MSEENKQEKAEVTAPVVEQQAAQEAQTDHSMSTTLNVLKSYGIEMPSREEPAAAEAGSAQTPDEASETQQGTEAPSAEVQSTPEGVGQVKDENVKDDVTVIKSPVFGDKGLSLEKKTEEPPAEGKRSFESLEDYDSYLKDEFGVENIQGLSEKFNNLSSLEEEHRQSTNQIDNLNSLFERMSPDLYQAVLDESNGKNWRETLSNSKHFDFSKNAEAQNKQDLVNHYSPNSVSQDEWEEYNDQDGDPGIKKAVAAYIEIAESKFTAEKNSFNANQNKLISDAKEKQLAFAKSAELAVSNLSTKVENVDKAYVSKVSERLKNDDILSVFKNEDGTLKEGAGVKLMMAMDGYEIMTQLQHAASVESKNKETEEILLRTASKTATSGGKNQQPGIRPEVQAAITKLEDSFGSKRTF